MKRQFIIKYFLSSHSPHTMDCPAQFSLSGWENVQLNASHKLSLLYKSRFITQLKRFVAYHVIERMDIRMEHLDMNQSIRNA